MVRFRNLVRKFVSWFPNKTIAILVSVVIAIALSASCVFAFIGVVTSKITNTFTPTSVPIEVLESAFDGVEKKDVSIKNNGTTNAYIRASVIITWKNNDNEIYGTPPTEGIDYTIVFPENSLWEKHSDGYYYYTEPVPPNGTTGILIQSCKPLQNGPTWYYLCVDIVAQSVQADGVDGDGNKAVELAWGVDPEVLGS